MTTRAAAPSEVSLQAAALPGGPQAPARGGGSAAQAWLRALELTAPIPRNRERLLSTVIEERALAHPDAPALVSDRESFTYGELAARMRRFARWGLEQGVTSGDVVGLLMPNRPEYLAVWLGITSIGGVVALLNTSLAGPSLTHSIETARANHLLVAEEYAEAAGAALAATATPPTLWMCRQAGTSGATGDPGHSIEAALEGLSDLPLTERERRVVTIDDLALLIYTSGTTGMPKAARVSHARVMQWSHWFAGMMQATPEDRVYDCLPMYHSVGGVQTPGAALVAGGCLVIRDRFSASRFWDDIVRFDCTIMQYIGELCRYLVRTAPSTAEARHRLRLACGNGLAADVWESFEQRFHIPQVLEFYASTEGGLSLFNVEGRRGAIGRVPPYLAHRFAPALIEIDLDSLEPVRDAAGLCVRAKPGESGEAISKVVEDPSTAGSRFEGYTDRAASERRLVRDVFAPGDCWLRTGDLMRQDEKRFFYFVDRLGDTFRWKGENVATLEVADALLGYPGVAHALVYGVKVPGGDGRIGMAALVLESHCDLAGLRTYLRERLPSYARPAFLRMQEAVDVTGTFKYRKSELVAEGYDPQRVADRLYFDSPEAEAFVPLDAALYARIERGEVRL